MEAAQQQQQLPHDPTEETTSAKQVVELQAQELNQLSTNEREQVFHEIHGVADAIPEDDPTFVTKKLIEFDLEIIKHTKTNASSSSSSSSSSSAAYGLAAFTSPEYVRKTEFRLQFLRGDAFDVVTAATRMISYFQQKLELFGPDKLTKDITLQDYDENDIKCLKTGSVQTLPICDRSGRAVICHAASFLGNDYHRFTIQNRLRALWYVYSFTVKDVDVQKRGIVFINYAVGLTGQFNREAAWKFTKLVKALPVRAVGLHMCFDSSRWQILTHVAMMVGGKRIRTHLRVHFGTHEEVQSKLVTFGVPCEGEIFPIGPDGGQRRTTNFLKMVKMWQKQDGGQALVEPPPPATTTTTTTTDNTTTTNPIIPGPNDVLLGRQKVVQEHSGNLHFRIIVNKFRGVYDASTTKLEKMEIAKNIVRIFKENNGRFLKLDDVTGCWIEEVEDKKGREKVAHIFRNQRSKTATSMSTSTTPPPQKQKQSKQQKSSKVRLRASGTEDDEVDRSSSTTRPSKKLRRMEEEEEQQENKPTKKDDNDDDGRNSVAVGSTSSWLGSLQEFLFGISR